MPDHFDKGLESCFLGMYTMCALVTPTLYNYIYYKIVYARDSFLRNCHICHICTPCTSPLPSTPLNSHTHHEHPTVTHHVHPIVYTSFSHTCTHTHTPSTSPFTGNMYILIATHYEHPTMSIPTFTHISVTNTLYIKHTINISMHACTVNKMVARANQVGLHCVQ